MLERIEANEVPDFLEACGSLLQGYGMSGTFCLPTATAVWKELVEKENGFIVSDVCPGEIRGVVAGFVNFDFERNCLVATEAHWYVAPEHRGSTIGIRLLRQFEKWAMLKGCKRIVCGYEPGKSPEFMSEMYAKLGYKKEKVLRIREL